MRRSVINEIIAESDAFMRSLGFVMPPFAYYSPAELKAAVDRDSAIIRDHGLGWDVTDYGQDAYEDLGLFLFTLRNGTPLAKPMDDANAGESIHNRNARARATLAALSGHSFCEKLMISGESQISPMHRHVKKTEDLINRGGATLVMELFCASPDGGIDENKDVEVRTDGRIRRLHAGDLLRLDPGESITLQPGCWHAFWGEGGRVLIGEVSNGNDDHTDNIFRDPLIRFSTISEDVAPRHLLVSDYDFWLQ